MYLNIVMTIIAFMLYMLVINISNLNNNIIKIAQMYFEKMKDKDTTKGL